MMRRLSQWTEMAGRTCLALCIAGSGALFARAQEQGPEQTEQQEQEQQQEEDGEQGEQEQQDRERDEEATPQEQEEVQQGEQEQQQVRRQEREEPREQRRFQGRAREALQQERGRTAEGIELGALLEDYGDRLVVSEIRDDSLAARAGLRRGDRIVAIDGRSVGSVDEVRQSLATVATQNGRVPLVIIRDDQRQTIYLDIDRQGQMDRRRLRDRNFGRRGEPWLGVILDPSYEDLAVVRRVYPGSAADEAGLRPGDWIVGINDRRVQSPAHLAQIINRMRADEQVDLRVARRVTRSIEARLGDADRRFQDDRLARPFQQRFRAEGERRSGFRGTPDGDRERDEFQEREEFQERDEFQQETDDAQEQRQQRDRRPLRDRLDRDRDEDRGLRGRLEGMRDRVQEFREEDR